MIFWWLVAFVPGREQQPVALLYGFPNLNLNDFCILLPAVDSNQREGFNLEFDNPLGLYKTQSSSTWKGAWSPYQRKKRENYQDHLLSLLHQNIFYFQPLVPIKGRGLIWNLTIHWDSIKPSHLRLEKVLGVRLIKEKKGELSRSSFFCSSSKFFHSSIPKSDSLWFKVHWGL